MALSRGPQPEVMVSTALVPITPTEPAAPAPEGLTGMQWGFVQAYVQSGNSNATKAARQAGYAADNCRQAGYRLMQNPAVQRALMNLTAATLSGHAPMALKTMALLARNGRSEFVRQQAAADILDRAGYKAPDKVQHQHAGTVSISIDLG